MMTATGAQAQGYDYETKHEVAVSYGIDSNSQIIDAFEEIGGAMFGAKLENEKFFGPISVEYFYHLQPWFGVGGIAVFACFPRWVTQVPCRHPGTTSRHSSDCSSSIPR